jgi:transposase-like protein
MARKTDPESVVREIKRKTRRKYSSEEKIRIVLEGLRGEESIAELCRREGISPNVYYSWSKSFLEAGKKRLSGDTKREATSNEVVALRSENDQLKQLVAELALHNRRLKSIGLRRRGTGRSVRYTQAEKMEVIGLVEGSSLPVKRTLEELDVPRSSFYRWYAAYTREGYEGLAVLSSDIQFHAVRRHLLLRTMAPSD